MRYIACMLLLVGCSKPITSQITQSDGKVVTVKAPDSSVEKTIRAFLDDNTRGRDILEIGPSKIVASGHKEGEEDYEVRYRSRDDEGVWIKRKDYVVLRNGRVARWLNSAVGSSGRWYSF